MKTINLKGNNEVSFEIRNDWMIVCLSDKPLLTEDRNMIESYLQIASQGGYRGAPQVQTLENGKIETKWVFLDPCDVDWS